MVKTWDENSGDCHPTISHHHSGILIINPYLIHMDNPIFDHNTFKQKTSCKLSSPTMNVGINGPAAIVSPDHHQI
jgi:hypothetical protein